MLRPRPLGPANTQQDPRGGAYPVSRRRATPRPLSLIKQEILPRAAFTGVGVAFGSDLISSLAAPSVTGVAGILPAASIPTVLAAGVFLGCVVGCMVLGQRAQGQVGRAMASLALGVLVAPALGLGCAAAPAYSRLVAILGLGAQWSFASIGTAKWSLSNAWIAPTVGAALVFSVAACDAALGVSGLAATAHALAVGSLACAVGALIVFCWAQWSLFMPCSYAKSFAVDRAVVRGMRLQGLSDDPTVLNTPPELINSLRRLLRQPKGASGLPVYLLEGQTGVGKTLMAQGIAEALGAKLIMTTGNRLNIDDIPMWPMDAMNFVALLGQTDMMAQLNREPTVLVIDEADTLLSLPMPGNGYPSPQNILSVGLVASALNALAEVPNRVTVVFVTNHAESTGIWKHISGSRSIKVPALTADVRVRMATLELERLAASYESRGIKLELMHCSSLAPFLALVSSHGWQGRQIAACIISTKRYIDAAYYDDAAPDPTRLSNGALEAARQHLGNERAFISPEPAREEPFDLEAARNSLEDIASGFAEFVWRPEMLADVRQAIARLHFDPVKQITAQQTSDRYLRSYQYLVSRRLQGSARRSVFL